MKTNCNLIQDILPLYVKSETSCESNALIEEHLNECTSCRALYELLLSDDTTGKVSSTDKSFGKSMRKLKCRFRIRTVLSVLIAIIIVSSLFLFGFWGIVPVKSSDVEIVPEAFIEKDQNGTDWYNVVFHLTLLKNGRCIDLRQGIFSDAEDSFTRCERTVYSQIKLPFDDRGDYPECFDTGVTFESLTGEEKMVFRFRDKDAEYNIKEIVEKAELLQ